MRIRLATFQDEKQVLDLFEEFNNYLSPQTLNPPQINRENSSRIFQEVVSRDDTFVFVADDDGQLVGMATFYLLPNIKHGRKRGHIEDFFVSVKAHRQGIGTQIFTAITDFAKNKGLKVIKWDSGNELTPAHKFYEKMGGVTSERFFRLDLN